MLTAFKSGVILPLHIVLFSWCLLGHTVSWIPWYGKAIGEKWVSGKCAVTEEHCPSLSGLTQVNLTLITELYSTFLKPFLSPCGSIKPNGFSSQITEASLGFSFTREFPESQNLILKIAVNVLLVNRCPPGFMSWPVCALAERELRPPPLLIWVSITQNIEPRL